MKSSLKPRPALRKLTQREDIDKSIKHFIDKIRLAGYDTFCSCSATVADHGDNPADLGSKFSYLMIKLPEGIVKYGRGIRIRHSEFRDKDVYHQLQDIGKKSGWKTIFIRRKKGWKTPFTRRNKHPTSNVLFNFCYHKRKPSDKRILQAWARLTKNLEKINAYKTYFQ